MTISSRTVEPGIVAVTVDYPPVNAIPSRGWFELADTITAVGREMSTHVVILRAEGRGFNAGVDIKEMQATEGFGALIDANRGCFAAFKAVYECEVPVVAAVNGFCVGGGIGLVGNADVIVASDDATFGLPEVERGALGAAEPAEAQRGLVLLRRFAMACHGACGGGDSAIAWPCGCRAGCGLPG